MRMQSGIYFLLGLTLYISVSYASQLELVNDNELLSLIKTEKYVVVFFSKWS